MEEAMMAILAAVGVWIFADYRMKKIGLKTFHQTRNIRR